MTDSEKLRQIIADLGIKKKKLAELCGVTRETVTNWISGKTKIPKSAMFVAEHLKGEK